MVLGIGCALVDVGVLSSMGTLVDTRHTPVYGTVFAVSLNDFQASSNLHEIHSKIIFELILDIGYGIVCCFCFGSIDWRCHN